MMMLPSALNTGGNIFLDLPVMNQKITLPLFTLVVVSMLFFECKPPVKTDPLQQIHAYVNLRIDSLQHWLDDDFQPLAEKANDTGAMRKSFLAGRKKYKQIEFALEYFSPYTAKYINGPALDEIEAEEHTTFEPGGLQVIEELLYPHFDTSSQSVLIREVRKLKSILVRAKDLWSGSEFRNDQIFDAVRLELFRAITLGISGFDTPVSETGISELPVVLNAIQSVMQSYKNDSAIAQQNQFFARLDDAISFTKIDTGFDNFDRMLFITRYINPLTTSLIRWQKQLNIPVLTHVNALNGDIETLFDSAAFNVNYFTPDANSFVDAPKVALGKRLFYDNILSGSNTISCATCHKPEKAFTDGLPKSIATAGKGFLLRNTPSLINAGLQKGQFYDMRALYLEDQVKDVIENKDEIHGSLNEAVSAIRNSKIYDLLFERAFPDTKDQVNERHIQVSLASYIRSLTSFNSRFDQYMRGDVSKMNKQEISGFNIFMGKAKCGICHFMPVFNGTVPPQFNVTESEVIGAGATAANKTVDGDDGRYGIFNIPNFKKAFKTSTIRNVELTAPYMHNGAYKTLEEVVEFYNQGGGNGFGFNLDNQTLPEDKLELSKDEKQQLIRFMKTLTDTSVNR